MAEQNPISILESYSIKNKETPRGLQQLFRLSEENFGSKRFDVNIFKNYSKKIRNRNQFKPQVVQEIGRMFTFEYRPKSYATLPYFDIQPLIISLSIPNSDEIFGMNLHYLPPSHRILAYHSIIGMLTDTNRESDNTRIRLLYDIMKTKKRYVRNMICIRQYKTNRIRSKVYEIDPKYWEFSLVLPTQRFVKKSEKTVYMDVNMQIRKLLGR